VSEPAELVRLRVLWLALRARGSDTPGAPGIDYARPVVQTSSPVPALPRAFGRHGHDPVAARLATMPPAERATLAWYRSHPADGLLAAGAVNAILDACAHALAPVAERAAWDRAAMAAHSTPRARTEHRMIAARAWASSRLSAAAAAWGVA
jgi:hypothetical protein